MAGNMDIQRHDIGAAIRRERGERGGAAYKITSTKTQDHTTHHQRTQATHLYESQPARETTPQEWARNKILTQDALADIRRINRGEKG